MERVGNERFALLLLHHHVFHHEVANVRQRQRRGYERARREKQTSVDCGPNVAEVRTDARQSAVDIENAEQSVALREKQAFVLDEGSELVKKRELAVRGTPGNETSSFFTFSQAPNRLLSSSTSSAVL